MPILTCENESPFNNLIRSPENKALIYTAGYPNSAVKRFIFLFNDKHEFLHWGDSDPEGLEIAAILHKIKPLQLYRCGITDCQRLKSYLKPLTTRKQNRAKKMLEAGNCPFKQALEFTLQYGWLEQEAWEL